MTLYAPRHYQPEERYILVEWINGLMNEYMNNGVFLINRLLREIFLDIKTYSCFSNSIMKELVTSPANHIMVHPKEFLYSVDSWGLLVLSIWQL